MAAPASERRGSTRTAVVWSALEPMLVRGSDAGSDAGSDVGLDVLDIGGGTGGLAVRIGELGHRVTVVDPSPDALAALDRRAREHDVAVAGRQGDLSMLLDVVAAGSADVVLCHGVLEIVDDPAAALAALARVLRPGGTLSLLVNQRHAAVVARAMAGHFVQARSMLDTDPPAGPTAGPTTGPTADVGQGQHRFTADEITALLDDNGLDVRSMHAVRVFVDLVPSSLVDLEPGAAQALVDLEHAVSTRPEYLALATQIH